MAVAAVAATILCTRHMPSRRNQIALTSDEQRRYLAGAKTIILTSIDHRGYPHPVAMWFAVEPDGGVVMTTYGRSQKVVNLRRNPKCALLVESGESYDALKGLLIRGRAEIQDDTERVLDVLSMVHARYAMPGAGSELREALRGQAKKRVVVRILPERESSWDHGKLGGVY
jgi:PPOX class probable F420-dependent enzyme